MFFMIFMTGWAMLLNLITYINDQMWLLAVIGTIVFVLEIWMIIEAVLFLKNLRTKNQKGVLSKH